MDHLVSQHFHDRGLPAIEVSDHASADVESGHKDEATELRVSSHGPAVGAVEKTIPGGTTGFDNGVRHVRIIDGGASDARHTLLQERVHAAVNSMAAVQVNI